MFKLTLLAEWSFNQMLDQKSIAGLLFTIQWPSFTMKFAWKYQCLMFKLTLLAELSFNKKSTQKSIDWLLFEVKWPSSMQKIAQKY